MVIEMLKHWEVAVDCFQIFLCLLILFFLARNHRHRMKPGFMNLKSESGQHFNLQVFSQTINQQVELAFANILQVAARERRNLDEALQLQQLNYADHSSAGSLTASLPSRRGDTLHNLKKAAGQGDRQTRIQELTAQGMSAKQISAELETPLGEVELILSLQKSRTN